MLCNNSTHADDGEGGASKREANKKRIKHFVSAPNSHRYLLGSLVTRAIPQAPLNFFLASSRQCSQRRTSHTRAHETQYKVTNHTVNMDLKWCVA